MPPLLTSYENECTSRPFLMHKTVLFQTIAHILQKKVTFTSIVWKLTHSYHIVYVENDINLHKSWLSQYITRIKVSQVKKNPSGLRNEGDRLAQGYLYILMHKIVLFQKAEC